MWVNERKDSNTYDGNNKLTEHLGQTWIISTWVNNYKIAYTYDGYNNLIETIGQGWNGSIWVNNYKYSDTYDENNNLTESLNQYWNNSAWMNLDKTSYTYDGNNNRTEWLQQSWSNSAWVNAIKYSYTYTPATAINDELNFVNSFILSNNYPNPFKSTTKIKYRVPSNVKGETGNIVLKIFDILGNEITTLVNEEKSPGTYEINWNAGGLPSGVYFYQIKTGAFIETKKMLLLR